MIEFWRYKMIDVNAIITIINEAFSDPYVQSFLISVAAGMAWDGAKGIGKIIPRKKHVETLSSQAVFALQETMESFYKHMKFEYNAEIVSRAFYEEYCNQKGLSNEFGLRSVLESTFGLEITDEEYKLWIAMYLDNASKYNILIRRLLMYESVEKGMYIERDLAFERLLAKLQKCINIEYIEDEFGNRLEAIFDQVNELFSNSWKDEILKIASKLSCPAANRGIVDRKLNFIRSSEDCDEVFEQIKELLKLYDYRGCSYDVISQINDFIRHPYYNKVLIVTGTTGSGKTYFANRYIKHCSSNFHIPDHRVMPLLIDINDVENMPISLNILKNLSDISGRVFSSLDNASDFVNGLEINICFVIDNIHLLLTDNTRRAEFFESIKAFSKYDCFSWLITIDEYEYYCLNDESHFLERYCISKVSALHTEEQKDSMFNYALSVNALNTKNNLIESILRDRYHISINCNVLNIVAGITTPREAEIYGQCVGDNTVLAFPSSYRAFIDAIVALKAKELAKCKEQSVLLTVISIIDYVIDHHDCTIKGYDLDDRNIRILRNVQLLSPTVTVNNNTFSVNQAFQVLSLRLQLLPYWASKMVGSRMIDNGTKSIQILGYPEELQQWLIPCFIFCNNEQGKEIDYVLPHLRDEQILEYAMFCACRDEDSFKFGKSLFEYLMVNLDYIDNAKRSYALLYFVYYSQLKISEKFQLLIGVSEQIKKEQLIDIYRQVLSSVVKTSGKLKKFKRNILELTRCTISDINYINGYCCADVLMELAKCENKSFDALIADIVIYIEEHELADTIQNGENLSFLDFLLRRCFENYLFTTSKSLIMIYDDYEEWFRIKNPIGVFIKRNLTCAAGNIFASKSKHKDGYDDQYIDLIHSFAEKNSFYEKATAWFLIRNSVSEFEPELDKRLSRILSFILDDPKIEALYEKEGRPFD